MNLGQQVLFFFSALGVFNGFVISIYLLAFKKSKSATSCFLGLLLLSLCLKIAKSFIFYFYPSLPGIYIQIGLLGSAWLGPSLFYLTRSALGKNAQNPTAPIYAYLFWTMIIVATSIIAPYDDRPQVWNDYIWAVTAIQFSIYTLLSAWLLKTSFLKFFAKGETVSVKEQLLIAVFIGNLIIPLAFKLPLFSFFNGHCISGALFFSLILYFNVFLFASGKRAGTFFMTNNGITPYANKKIADEQALALTQKLQKILSEEAIYKNPDLKLHDLAKKMGISSHQLSQLLNDNLGKSFAAYINEYRIDEACQMIASQQSIKLEAIGYEVGFNSKSTFYTAFKKHKHTTPMLYKEQLVSPAN